MSIYVRNEHGTVEISNDVIATVVGTAATETVGIIGMASKNQVRDGINEILGSENYARGVVVKQEENSFSVDVHIIVEYGVKISEVCRNLQERINYQITRSLGLSANSINIFVQSIRVTE